MIKVLTLCLGNICRSPLAEGLIREIAEDKGLDVYVDSCGTANYHVGEAPDPRSIRVAAENGIDISNLVGRQLHAQDFETFDFILAMDHSNMENAKRICPNQRYLHKLRLISQYETQEHEIVKDPYYGDYSGFEKMFVQLKDAAEGFVEKECNV